MGQFCDNLNHFILFLVETKLAYYLLLVLFCNFPCCLLVFFAAVTIYHKLNVTELVIFQLPTSEVDLALLD